MKFIVPAATLLLILAPNGFRWTRRQQCCDMVSGPETRFFAKTGFLNRAISKLMSISPETIWC